MIDIKKIDDDAKSVGFNKRHSEQAIGLPKSGSMTRLTDNEVVSAGKNSGENLSLQKSKSVVLNIDELKATKDFKKREKEYQKKLFDMYVNIETTMLEKES